MSIELIVAFGIIALLLFLLHKVNKMAVDIDKEYQKDVKIKENTINRDSVSLYEIEQILNKQTIQTQDIIKCIKIASFLVYHPDKKNKMIDELIELLYHSIQNGGKIN